MDLLYFIFLLSLLVTIKRLIRRLKGFAISLWLLSWVSSLLDNKENDSLNIPIVVIDLDENSFWFVN